MKFFKVNCLSLLIFTVFCAVSQGQDDMVLIPTGEYEMGDHYSKDRPYWLGNQWAPVHKVYIDAFWMDKYEVTNGKYVEYLSSAYSQGMIEVSNGVVRKAGGTENYCSTSGVQEEYSPFIQLHWDGSEFAITQGWEKNPMAQVT